MTEDYRNCIYSWQCGKVSQDRDPQSKLIFCSAECQTKYYKHKEAMLLILEREDPDGDQFRQLWRLHVSLTRQVVMEMAKLDSDNDLDIMIVELMQNQVDIGNMFKRAYGETYGKAVTALLQEHIKEAKLVMDELLMRVGTSIADYKEDNRYYDAWFQQGQQIADALAKKMGGQTGTFRIFMRKHIEMTLEEMMAIVNGEAELSQRMYDTVMTDIVAFANFLLSFRPKSDEGEVSATLLYASDDEEVFFDEDEHEIPKPRVPSYVSDDDDDEPRLPYYEDIDDSHDEIPVVIEEVRPRVLVQDYEDEEEEEEVKVEVKPVPVFSDDEEYVYFSSNNTTSLATEYQKSYRDTWLQNAQLLRQLIEERVNERVDREAGDEIAEKLQRNGHLIAEGAELESDEKLLEWLDDFELLIDSALARKKEMGRIPLTLEDLKSDNAAYSDWSRLLTKMVTLLGIFDIKLLGYKKAILEELLAFVNDDPESVEEAHRQVVMYSGKIASMIEQK